MTDGRRVGLFTAATFAAGAVTTAFLPVWLADRGFAAASIGTVLGIASAVRVVAVPAWGMVADRLGTGRPVLVAASLLAAATAAGYATAADPALLATLVVVGGVAASALTPLTDALTVGLAALGRLLYARTRVWGSVSFMLATAAAGPLVGAAGSGVVPWLVAGSFALGTVLAAGVPEAPAVPRPAIPAPGLLRNRALLLSIGASALIQGSHAAYYGFAALFWRAAGIGDTAIGLLIAEGIVFEIVLFGFGGAWAERLGPARLTAIAACACILRWGVTAATTDLAALALVQILHAATFACQHLSSMAVLRRVSGHRASAAQAIHSALGFSAPTGLLIWLSGSMYGARGGVVFAAMAGVGGAALLLVRPLARAVSRPEPAPAAPG